MPGDWAIERADNALHERLLTEKIIEIVEKKFAGLPRLVADTDTFFHYTAHWGTLTFMARGHQGPTGAEARAVLDCLVALAEINAAVNTEAPPERHWPWSR